MTGERRESEGRREVRDGYAKRERIYGGGDGKAASRLLHPKEILGEKMPRHALVRTLRPPSQPQSVLY
jgi:hypothetical protein